MGSGILYIGIPREAADFFRNGAHPQIPVKSRASASLRFLQKPVWCFLEQ